MNIQPGQVICNQAVQFVERNESVERAGGNNKSGRYRKLQGLRCPGQIGRLAADE